jgi:hypothetical protein
MTSIHNADVAPDPLEELFRVCKSKSCSAGLSLCETALTDAIEMPGSKTDSTIPDRQREFLPRLAAEFDFNPHVLPGTMSFEGIIEEIREGPTELGLRRLKENELILKPWLINPDAISSGEILHPLFSDQ